MITLNPAPRTNTRSLRIVRFEVADGIYENIITNLPVTKFSPDELKQLYHMRWDTEISFQNLKHTIGTTNFHSTKAEYIEQEIWARLILFNFYATITAYVVIEQKKYKICISSQFCNGDEDMPSLY
ncbi:transposase [Lachnospiraceae bacterium ZAX-1]